MLFLGIMSTFETSAESPSAESSSDETSKCSKYSNKDKTKSHTDMLGYVKRCRNNGCTFNFNFNSPSHMSDYTGECVEFVKSDCSSYDNAADCHANPQCNFDDKTCKTNKKCADWRNDTKMCNRHNDVNGTPCQPNASKKCSINEGGAKPYIPK